MTPNPQNADKFDVEEECEQKAIAITGSCNCHEDYTSRKMKDPHCDYHNFAPEIKEALAAAVKRIRNAEEAIKSIIPFIEEDFPWDKDVPEDKWCVTEEYKKAYFKLKNFLKYSDPIKRGL